jgi:DNA-binding XRE family transcriptional regulator
MDRRKFYSVSDLETSAHNAHNTGMTNEHSTPLGELITRLRTEAGLSGSELAKRSGVDKSQLYKIENGFTQSPSSEKLQQIARALDVDVEDLYEALWRTNPESLPSTPTFFRTAHGLSDRQIEQVIQFIDHLPPDTSPADPKK